MPLDRLPPEIALQVLFRLPVQTIHALQAVSRAFCALIRDDENRSAIYRHAAFFHGFIPSVNLDLAQAKRLYASPFLVGVRDWHKFCVRRFEVERRWCGHGPSLARASSLGDLPIHRIKVDEEAGYAIVSVLTLEDTPLSTQIGVAVIDLKRDDVLWALPQTYTGEFPHVEYENGFIIFNTSDGSKDVWRRASDMPAHDDACSPQPYPSTTQLDVDPLTFDNNNNAHGQFVPWGHLVMPELSHAFRFVYPTLLVAGTHSAYLWDVPSGRLNDIDRGAGPFELTYVELSPRHAIMCYADELCVYSRASGALVWKVPVNFHATQTLQLRAPPDLPSYSMGQGIMQPVTTIAATQRLPLFSLSSEFIAAHVSRCGRHLVVLLADSKLLLLEDFERVIEGKATFEQVCTYVILGAADLEESVYLAYEHGRVAVVTAAGIYVLTLEDCLSIASYSMATSFMNLRAARVIGIDSARSLREISCLQLTELGVWFTWDNPWGPKHVYAFDPYGIDDDGFPRLAWVDLGASKAKIEQFKGPFGALRHVEWRVKDRTAPALSVIGL